jgi:hypothetical protein
VSPAAFANVAEHFGKSINELFDPTVVIGSYFPSVVLIRVIVEYLFSTGRRDLLR